MAQLTTFSNLPVDDLSWLQTYWGKAPQRLFWIYQVAAQQSRGGHRHTSGQMVLRCVVGSVKIYVQTPQQDQWYTLDDPTTCLFANPEDWRLMYDFSPDAILLVVAEEHFSRTDYIDDPYRPIPATITGDEQDSTDSILLKV